MHTSMITLLSNRVYPSITNRRKICCYNFLRLKMFRIWNEIVYISMETFEIFC